MLRDNTAPMQFRHCGTGRSIGKAAGGKAQAVGAGTVLSSGFGLLCRKVLLLRKYSTELHLSRTLVHEIFIQAAALPALANVLGAAGSHPATRYVTGGGYRH